MPPLLVCRMGWMDYYAGIVKGGDRITGGGRYVDQHGYGFEIYNFLRDRSRVYGYVKVHGTNNIARLGADEDSDKIDNVTVVWAARRPTGGVYVVGWYRNATVFKDYQRHPNDRRRRQPNSSRLMGWNVTAKAADAHLLPDVERLFKLPVGRNALGSSLTTYVDGPTRSERDLRRRLLKYAGSSGTRRAALPRRSRRGGGRRQQDPALRLKIEEAAMRVVARWYEQHGFMVKPVYRDRVGWDLEARSNGRLLRLEVKGCSSSEAACELTPNELTKMTEYRDSYHLCIVTGALTRKPHMEDFRFVSEAGKWLDSDRGKRELVLKPLTGAFVTVR